MSVDQARLLSTTDALAWAEEFAKIQPSVDRGLMVTWFAAALETGRDAGVRYGTGQRSLGPGARTTRAWPTDEQVASW